MKKRFFPLLLAAALLLSGCGKKDEARYDAFASELRSRADLVVTAEVRAEQDESTCSFTLRYAETTDGGCVVEVIEPELIRGVKARMNADGTKLIYDSVAVDTGDDGGTGLSPMGALPLLVRALRHGSVDSVWKESGELAVLLVPEDDVDVTVLFDSEMKPHYAEIAHDGKAVLFLDISEFS